MEEKSKKSEKNQPKEKIEFIHEVPENPFEEDFKEEDIEILKQ